MTQDEACDIILWGLYDRELADTGSGIHGLGGILREAGCDDPRVAVRAANYLDGLGLLTHFTEATGYHCAANIGPRAMRIMERLSHGASVMDALHTPRETPSPVANTYHGPVFHGDVAGSNVAIDSPNATQSITNGSDLTPIVEAMIEAIKGDRSLPDADRDEAVEDAETLKEQLERQRPNSKVVTTLLKALSLCATAAVYVAQIRAAIGK